MRFIKTFESYRRTDRLSGILLYVEGHILLVHAKKHKDSPDMWSLPKGHIEGSPLKSALKELKEETGIKLDKNHDGDFTIRYNKSGIHKVLTIFVYERKLSDLSKFISDSLDIKKKVLKKVDDEIYDVKLFPLVDALYFLEPGQRQIINHLIHY
jgi:8-oxo-dGTP pyrophosphatase MutT (NUDIX family)